MAGPWEKYGASSQAPQQAGPWSKYAGPTRANAADAGLPPSLEEGLRAEGAAGVPAPPPMGFGLADRAINGLLMGYGDEVSAGVGALAGVNPQGEFFDYSRPFGDRYQQSLGAVREGREQFREEHPYLGGAAEVAGALAGVGGAAKQGVTLMGRAGTNAGRVGAGAAEGAAYGGVYGSGEATEGNRLEGGLYGAATGALLGGATAGIGNTLADVIVKRRTAAAAPSSEALGQGIDAAYKTARDQGVIYSPKTWQAMLKDLEGELAGEAFDKGLHPNAGRVLERLREVQDGTGVTLQGAEVYRRLIGAANNPQNASEQRLLGMMRSKLDDYMTDPANVLTVQGDAGVAMNALQEGRKLYANQARGETVQKLVEAAELQAGSTWSGGNIENALRQQFKKILTNDKLGRGFSAEEKEIIREFVTGGSKFTRVLAKLSPQGSGLMAALGIGATATNPLMAAVPATGIVAKSLRDRGAQAGAEQIGGLVRGRGLVPPQVPPYLLAPDRRAMIARILAAEGGATAPEVMGLGQ